jgi:hypothetical protein
VQSNRKHLKSNKRDLSTVQPTAFKECDKIETEKFVIVDPVPLNKSNLNRNDKQHLMNEKK